MSWVLDPDDDAACVRALFRLHDLAAGLVVCHPHPAATWPVLVADLLRALGKHPRALSRERRITDGTALLQVWLRAENVRDLVVLRAHLLAPDVLAHLVDHTATADSALWLGLARPGPASTAAPVPSLGRRGRDPDRAP